MINPPLAGYLGGKSQLAKRIVNLMPEHTCYCEVFAGAAWVLFRKPFSKAEVVNDINGDVVNLYKVIQHHLEEFIRQFKWILLSRDEFERLRRVDPSTLTDIQRAARFYYLHRMGFGGQGRTFGTTTTTPPRLNLTRIEESLSAAHLRLAQVQVERLSYADCITRYDRPHTLFYLDPPYFGCEDDYGKNIFERADFVRIAAQLAGIAGKFILSINDKPEIREIFSDFVQEEVQVRYSVGTTKRRNFGELIIRNF